MNRLLRGAWWGAWSMATLFGLLSALRPGFLMLDDALSWLLLTSSIGAAAAVGALAGALISRADKGFGLKRAAALVLIPIGLLAFGATSEDDVPRGDLDTPWRVVILGVDGATWEVIEPMIERRDLPNFERLQREGAWGILESEKPTISPRVWTTMAAGVGPERHGAVDFYSTQASLKVPRMWEVIEQNGGRIGIWGWLLTWPPGEPNGFLVPGWLAKGPETWPPQLGFYNTLRDESHRGLGTLATAALRGYWNGLRMTTLFEAVQVAVWTKLSKPTDRQSTPRTLALQTKMSSDLFLHRWRQEGPDLGALIIYETDTLAHMFWQDFEPEAFGLEAEPSDAEFAATIPDAYERVDGVLGRIMEAADERTLLIVVSDHGTAARELSRNRFSIRSAKLLDLLEMKDELVAVSVGGYLHLRYADPELAEAADIEVLQEKLESVLVGEGGLFQVSKSEPPFLTVAVAGEPDMQGTARLGDNQVAVSEVVINSEFSGEHTLDGIIAFWGRPVQPGRLSSIPNLRDVAPTVLAILGSPLSQEMSGQVLMEALKPSVADSLTIRRVDSFDPPRHLLEGLREEVDSEEELKERLRALGYLE